MKLHLKGLVALGLNVMWRSMVAVPLTAGLLLVPTWSRGSEPAPQAGQSTYVLRASVMGGAGVPTQAGGFRQTGTLAQATPVGVCTESGNTLYAGFWRAWMAVAVTGIEHGTPSILVSGLHQNHPNPFSPTTSIEYTVAQPGLVEITIYNIRGQRIRQLVSEIKPMGRHQLTWDGASDQGAKVAQGIYFYRLRIGSFSEVKKMVVLK